MLICIIGVIGIFFTVAHAGSTCTSASGDVDGFNACVAESLGSGGADDPRSACAGNTGDSYNACMCTAASSVVKCYSNHCAGDAGLRGVTGDQAAHCNVKASTTAALTTAALTTAALSTTLGLLSEDFVPSSIVFSTFPASAFVTLPSAPFSYPTTTVGAGAGVNIDDLPPFPNSGRLKDPILAGIALYAVTILMLFA